MSLETETVLATEGHHHFSMNNHWEEYVDYGVPIAYKHVASRVHNIVGGRVL